MARVFSRNEFNAYIDKKAEIKVKQILKEWEEVDTLKNAKASKTSQVMKEDVKGFGSKDSKGNSDKNANWTKGNPGGKNHIEPNESWSENSDSDLDSSGGVQKASAKTGNFLDGKKGKKPSFS